MAQNFISCARVTILFSVLLCLASHLVPIAEVIWLNIPSSGTKCMSEDIQTNVVVLADYYVVDKGVQPHHTPTIFAKVLAGIISNNYGDPVNGLRMAGSSISDKRYTYIHDSEWPSEAADVHHIVVRKSGAKGFLVYLSALLILANGFHLFLVKDKSIIIVFWSFLLDVFLVKLMLQKPVKKESVIVMPAFGIQLETHYVSGKTIRRFIPIDKILKPTLSECLTPVTCYWSLSFIVRGEAELMLAFKELRPPVKMLVPIWKALCAATGSGGSFDTLTDDGPRC